MPSSGSPLFAIMAVPMLRPVTHLTFFYAFCIPSVHFDRRNMGLSRVPGNRCVNNPSPSLPYCPQLWNMDDSPALPPSRLWCYQFRECGLPGSLHHPWCPTRWLGERCGGEGQPLWGAWGSGSHLGRLLPTRSLLRAAGRVCGLITSFSGGCLCAVTPQETPWASTEVPAFSEFYLLISLWVTQPCQDLFPSYYLAGVFLMAPFLMMLKQRDDGGG